MELKRLALGAAAAVIASAAAATDAHALLLWGDSAGSNAIEAFDPTNGDVVHQYSPGTGNGRGMVVVGNTAYYTVVGNGHIYELNATTGAPIGSISTGQTSLATIAYDGKNFWLGDYSGSNHAYHFNLSSGTIDQTITLSNCAGYCDGLEYFVRNNTGYLISNRYDGGDGGANKYDIYDLSGNLVTSDFITGQDATGNTGIAYDGKDFYISNIFDGSVSEFDGVTGAFIQTIKLGLPLPSGGRLIEDLSFDYSQVIPPTVPEPASLALLGAGLAALGAVRRRRAG